jgi:hypothetical protein
MNAQTKRPIASGKRVACGACSGTGLEVNGRYQEGRWIPILTSWACTTCKGSKKILWSEGLLEAREASLEVAS